MERTIEHGVTHVFERLVGQGAVEAELINAANAARLGSRAAGSAMTHSWLFTGPPGSGRSIAALCFAAALQCTGETVGCGECSACRTTLAGTHGDVRRIIPDGLSISIREVRDMINIASRRPTTGRWQIVVVEDADRLSEGAANALLKMVEEPPDRTVILLCAPTDDPEDFSVTLRSRCRHVQLVTPTTAEIAQVLTSRDGLEPRQAHWAASVSGGHVGRARRLATDPEARERREQALKIASAAQRPASAYAAAAELDKYAVTDGQKVAGERNQREIDEMMVAMGSGGTGKGAASATRGIKGALGELEKRQKSRETRTIRDTYDRALIDLAGLYRDALAASFSSTATPTHPDYAEEARRLATVPPEQLLRCLEAILDCREALSTNVKPKFALAALVASLGAATRHD